MSTRIRNARKSTRLLGSLFACLLSSTVLASPWVDISDSRTRHNLEWLNDSGVFSVPLTTWPILWADVHAALGSVTREQRRFLSTLQIQALEELEFELRRHTANGIKTSITLAGSNSRDGLRTRDDGSLEKGSISTDLQWDGDFLAVGLSPSIETDPGDDAFQIRYDGSFVAAVAGPVVLGAGAFDRWWGPGNYTSLILSNSARPVKSVFARNREAFSFESPWLSWLGRMQLLGFIGVLEDDRVIPDARVTGMRLVVQPIPSLEIGFSRAMMWGGEGRDNGFKAFWKSLLAQDENTEDGAGNQLGGFDARYKFLLADRFASALYFQAIGEDEAGILPTEYLVQFGAQTQWALPSGTSFLKVYAEVMDTTAGALTGQDFNVAYNHSIYQSGYRFRDRSLGATTDNDSRAFLVGMNWQAQDGKQADLVLGQLDLNRDDTGLNPLSPGAQELLMFQASYSDYVFGGRGRLGIRWLSEEPVSQIVEWEQAAIEASWEYRF